MAVGGQPMDHPTGTQITRFMIHRNEFVFPVNQNTSWGVGSIIAGLVRVLVIEVDSRQSSAHNRTLEGCGIPYCSHGRTALGRRGRGYRVRHER